MINESEALLSIQYIACPQRGGRMESSCCSSSPRSRKRFPTQGIHRGISAFSRNDQGYSAPFQIALSTDASTAP
jgi:hypothetical protein